MNWLFFDNPIWLILLIPVAVACWNWASANKILSILRLLVMLLIVIALCQPGLKISSAGGTIVVLADRSRSMPAKSEDTMKENIDYISSHLPKRTKLAVVSFAERSAVDFPPQASKFPGFVSDVGKHQSIMADGLKSASSLIGTGGGRILVLSDGQWTGDDPLNMAPQLIGKKIAVDYRLMERPSVSDLSITKIDHPVSVSASEPYLINAWINSPVKGSVDYELRRNNAVISKGTRNMDIGLNHLMLRDQASDAGVASYTLSIKAPNDTIPENNTARFLVESRGEKKVLLISESPSPSLAKALANSGIKCTVMNAGSISLPLETLAGYSCVLLENISANKLGLQGMKNLREWVKNAGGSLMITGGKQSYGPGGYFRSPLEEILPVSMEIKKENRKLAVAIVVALDRSGSMAMSAGGGKMKIELADMGAVQVLDLLSNNDEFGVIAVDSIAHNIVDLNTVDINSTKRNNILRIDSMGGGIFIYEALEKSIGMVAKAKASTRHVILFADASDSEEPGNYRELLRKARTANITVSVIGMGLPTDCDADLLRDVAKEGGGECYFTNDPYDFPRLFAQDTFTVTRNAFLEEKTAVKILGGMKTITSQVFTKPNALGGYNVCYLRPGAIECASTLDDNNAPVAAAWQSELGKVVCFTGEADGKFTGSFGSWDQAGQFLGALAGWCTARKDLSSESFAVECNVQNGACNVSLHLDPERTSRILDKSTFKFLRGSSSEAPKTESVTPVWKGLSTMQSSVPIIGDETILPVIQVDESNVLTLSPVCLPYSPEFQTQDKQRGKNTLDYLASITGGRERLDIASLISDMPDQIRYIDITPYVILASLLLLLFEILERRTGIISARISRIKQSIEIDTAPASGKIIKPDGKQVSTPKPSQDAKAPTTESAPAQQPPQPSDDNSLLSSIKEARRKSNKRLK